MAAIYEIQHFHQTLHYVSWLEDGKSYHGLMSDTEYEVFLRRYGGAVKDYEALEQGIMAK